MKVRVVHILLEDLARYIGERIEVEGAEQRIVPTVLRAEVTMGRPNILQVLIEHPDFQELLHGADVPWLALEREVQP